jgi:hypothetical protein
MGDGSCVSLIDDESLKVMECDKQYVGKYLGLYNNESEIYICGTISRPMLGYVKID